MTEYKRYVVKRGDWYHFQRAVPAAYKSVDRRRWVRQALKTRDYAEAVVRAGEVNRRVTAYWASLVKSGSAHSNDRYRAAIDLASVFGIEYRPFSEVIQLPPREFVQRASLLADQDPENPAHFKAIFGTEDKPRIKMSTLLAEYEKIAKDETTGKNADQLRVWRNPRKRAVANWIKVVSDCDIDDITQYHTLDFRDWWLERIEVGNLKPGSANKDLSHLNKMHRVVCKFHRIDHIKPFQDTYFSEGIEGEKYPFSRDWIETRILPGIASMNDEARALLMIVASTGARPSEPARAPNEKFRLDADIPHLIIEPADKVKIKTKYSKRIVPLCGSALDGARLLVGLKKRRYMDKTSSLSAVVNKYLSDHNLRETPNHSFYSLRHTFQDGLTALDVPDRMQTELMGHKFDRPVYGTGPTLEHKKKVVEKLAFFVSV
jgi:hypothetical protein